MTKTIYNLKSVINFGKYKSKDLTIEEAIEKDPDYIEWCAENIEWFELDQAASDMLDDVLLDDMPFDNDAWEDETPY